MADLNLSGVPPPSLSPSSHQNGRIGPTAAKRSPHPHHDGRLEAGAGHLSPSNTGAVPQILSAPRTRTSACSSPLRNLRILGGPGTGSGPEGSQRPRGQSLSSALSSRTRAMISRSKRGSSQQEEPEALLDLILEGQGQRLEDQRASLSLLPDPGPAALCGACIPDQPAPPSLDFYYMLIHYQSDRMEDQRCSLPDLDDVIGPVPDGQEDFFSLVQRVQSRRMNEQRSSLLPTHSEEEEEHPAPLHLQSGS